MDLASRNRWQLPQILPLRPFDSDTDSFIYTLSRPTSRRSRPICRVQGWIVFSPPRPDLDLDWLLHTHIRIPAARFVFSEPCTQAISLASPSLLILAVSSHQIGSKPPRFRCRRSCCLYFSFSGGWDTDQI